MTTATFQALLLTSLTAAGGGEGGAREPATGARASRENYCVECHGQKELWEGETLRLFVRASDFAADVHWQNGLRCHDCHGGDPTTSEVAQAHSIRAGYRRVISPADVPEFCGGCHANFEYMRRFRPFERTDQLSEYWTSGHGQRLKKDGDPKVATCISCHRHHGTRRINDMQSRVFPTQVAKTCATCHSDPKVTAGRQYHGRPLGHRQFELWSASVHGEALLKKGDLSAPACNDCHGHHGAVPPDVDSVANACGTCHTKMASLFARARMKHRFEEVGLPGCATCHGYHDIRAPSDKMLGMGDKSVCVHCHAEGQLGAPLAGARTASAMRSRLEQLKTRLAEAERKLSQAERLGMDVRRARFDLHNAFTALTNARSLVHSFSLDAMSGSLEQGLQFTDHVVQDAEDALRTHTIRRIWVGLSVLPILAVILLLLRYIRTLPPPPVRDPPTPQP